MSVKDLLNLVNSKGATLVAATKYFTAEQMRELYHEGITHFGENRVQSLLDKQALLSDLDITWHFIGTLQTKKIKKLANTVTYMHSVHSIKTAIELDKRQVTPLKCMLQVNISHEESKHGFLIEEVLDAIKEINTLKNIEIVGFMGMASHVDDKALISSQFQLLNDLQLEVKQELGIDLVELSIGMSNDYLVALEHNATFIRLGSALLKEEV